MDTKTSRKRLRSIICCIIAGLLLTSISCSAPKHHDAIFFVTNTQVGLKIGADAYQRPTIEVGYNRQEGAVVPLYLANAEKYLSAHDPFVQGLLVAASANLDKQRPNADDIALQLVDQAINIYDDKLISKPSPILLKIKEEMLLLKNEANTAKKKKRALIKDLISVEIEKPKLVAQFSKDAKYIAKENSDAYSVFATFSGSTGASSIANFTAGSTNGIQQNETSPTPGGNANTTFKGNIAQSFATGVAAQIWAAQGAGIAGGTPNKIEILTASTKKGIAKTKTYIVMKMEILFVVAPNSSLDSEKWKSLLDKTDLESSLKTKLKKLNNFDDVNNRLDVDAAMNGTVIKALHKKLNN